jgi:rod shape-determining protein MreD
MGVEERTHNNVLLRLMTALVPLVCGFAGVAPANIPISFVGGLVPPPLLGLVPVYFWCLVRPDLMTPAAALIVGIMEDVMSGAPPGTWTLAFVISYAVVARQRDSFAGLSGLGAVLGFAAAALAACTSAYFTVAALNGRMPPIGPVVAELAMTVICYLPGTLIVGSIHRRLVGPLRSDF